MHWSSSGPLLPQAKLFDSNRWPVFMLGRSHLFFGTVEAALRGVFSAMGRVRSSVGMAVTSIGERPVLRQRGYLLPARALRDGGVSAERARPPNDPLG